MNCRQFEPLIALYCSRDLEGRDVERVEAHLAECPDCRELLGDLREGQVALRELGTEPVDAALLAAVRSGVLAATGERRRVVWPWIAGLAAAAAVVAGLMVTPPPRVVPESRPVVAVLPVPRDGETAEAPKAPAPRRRRVARRAPAVKEGEPLVVKMLTDDPNIVIIWLVDQRGD